MARNDVSRDKEKAHAYYLKNKQRYIDNAKKYAAANSEKKHEYDRQWYADNKDKIKKWREANRTRINKWHVNSRKDPVRKLAHRLRCLLGTCLRHNAWGKTMSTEEVIGISYQELCIHLGIQPGSVIPMDVHVDHIVPLNQARTEDELIKLMNWRNLRLMPAKDNLSKGDRPTPEGEVLCLELLGRGWVHGVTRDGVPRSSPQLASKIV